MHQRQPLSPEANIESQLRAAKLAMQAKDYDSAEKQLTSLLAVAPKDTEVLFYLGLTLFSKNDFSQAFNYLKKASKLDSGNPGIWNALGSVLHSQGKLQDAQLSFKKAIQINPKLDSAHHNLAFTYQVQGRYSDAEKSYLKAIASNPNYGSAFNKMGFLLQDQGRIEDAIGWFRKAVHSNTCQQNAHSNLLLALNYSSILSAEQVFEEHRQWGNSVSSRLKIDNQALILKHGKQPLRKIGYISPDFRAHSVAYFFEPLLTAHNHEKYEVYCYYNHTIEDETTGRLKALAGHWRNIAALSDEDVIRQIIADEIDILIDLAGHTGKGRPALLATRAAPLQVAWLGYPNTTGLQTVDYRLTDHFADPKGLTDQYYTEKLLRLDNGFLCYQGKASVVPSNQTPLLKNGFVTFGSFNNMTKVTDEVIETWSNILQSVSNSQLILKCPLLQSNEYQMCVLSKFEAFGIKRNRIKLYNKIANEDEHLRLYNKIDLCLDPFPYNGTTTTCEALWMGVPVITFAGDRHAGRVGLSILHHAGLPELVAEDKVGYVQKAILYATSEEALLAIRDNLRERVDRSLLCDAKRFTKCFEDSFECIWQS